MALLEEKLCAIKKHLESVRAPMWKLIWVLCCVRTAAHKQSQNWTQQITQGPSESSGSISRQTVHFSSKCFLKKNNLPLLNSHGGTVTVALCWLRRRFNTISAAKKKNKVNHLSLSNGAVEKNCRQGLNNPPQILSGGWNHSFWWGGKKRQRKGTSLKWLMPAPLKLLQPANHGKSLF